ncbi:MAG: hypothetical protein NC293_12540 [Roseburia sp.]|nr:hypothetical protein [Roseburia sp.]
MSSLIARLEFKGEKLKEIMERLDKAQQEIQNCYFELRNLNAFTVYETSDEDEPAAK